jgi:hypothetical protein
MVVELFDGDVSHLNRPVIDEGIKVSKKFFVIS